MQTAVNTIHFICKLFFNVKNTNLRAGINAPLEILHIVVVSRAPNDLQVHCHVLRVEGSHTELVNVRVKILCVVFLV